MITELCFTLRELQFAEMNVIIFKINYFCPSSDLFNDKSSFHDLCSIMHVGLIKIGYFSTGDVNVHFVILWFFFILETIFLICPPRRQLDVKIPYSEI